MTKEDENMDFYTPKNEIEADNMLFVVWVMRDNHIISKDAYDKFFNYWFENWVLDK